MSADTPSRPHHDTALPAGALERQLGKPPAGFTVDDLCDIVGAQGIRLVHLMHVGGDGWLKTLDFAPRSAAHLRDVLEGGERADGSSLFAGFGVERGASDIVLRPRLTSAFLDPFSPEPALAVLCSHIGRDGAPLAVSPDTVVRAAATRVARECGVELYALGEVEYFLGKRVGENDIYGEDERGYHATAPFVYGEALRREALATLSSIGMPVKYGHAEVGYIEPSEVDGIAWEQHEIELALAPLGDAADHVVVTQWVLRNLAHREGMRCTFDPLIRKGHAGSGLHFHVSPAVDGAHRGGRGADGKLTEPSRWLIGGLAQAGGALMAFGNRSRGSFGRLLQGKEAPSTVVWGEFDRQALIRIPVVATTADGRGVSPPTIEFRLPDGSAHPHLLLAGVAQALLLGRATDGLDALIERTSSAVARANPAGATAVPRNFAAVAGELTRLRAVFEAGGVFPAAMLDGVMESLLRP